MMSGDRALTELRRLDSLEQIRNRLERVKKRSAGVSPIQTPDARSSRLAKTPHQVGGKTGSGRVAYLELEIARNQEAEHLQQIEELVETQRGLRLELELCKRDRVTQAALIEKLFASAKEEQEKPAEQPSGIVELQAEAIEDLVEKLRGAETKTEAERARSEALSQELATARAEQKREGDALAERDTLRQSLQREQEAAAERKRMLRALHAKLAIASCDDESGAGDSGQSPTASATLAQVQQLLDTLIGQKRSLSARAEAERARSEALSQELATARAEQKREGDALAERDTLRQSLQREQEAAAERKRMLRALHAKLAIASCDDESGAGDSGQSPTASATLAQVQQLLDTLIGQKRSLSARAQRLEEAVEANAADKARTVAALRDATQSGDEARTMQEAAAKEISTLKASLAETRQEAKASAAQCEEVAAEASLAQSRVRTLESKLEALQRRFTDETSRLIKASDDNEAKLNTMAEMVTQAKHDRVRLNNDITELEQTNQSLQSQLEQANSRATQAETLSRSLAAAQAEIRALRQQTEDAAATVREKDAVQNATQATVTRLTTRLQEATKAESEARAKINKFEATVMELQEASGAERAAAVAWRAKLAGEMRRGQGLQGQLGEAESRIRGLEAQLQAASDRADRVSAQLQDAILGKMDAKVDTVAAEQEKQSETVESRRVAEVLSRLGVPVGDGIEAAEAMNPDQLGELAVRASLEAAGHCLTRVLSMQPAPTESNPAVAEMRLHLHAAGRVTASLMATRGQLRNSARKARAWWARVLETVRDQRVSDAALRKRLCEEAAPQSTALTTAGGGGSSDISLMLSSMRETRGLEARASSLESENATLREQRKAILKKLKRYNAFYEQVKATADADKSRRARAVRRINQLQDTVVQLAERLRRSQDRCRSQRVEIRTLTGALAAGAPGGGQDAFHRLRESLLKQLEANATLKEDVAGLEAKNRKLIAAAAAAAASQPASSALVVASGSVDQRASGHLTTRLNRDLVVTNGQLDLARQERDQLEVDKAQWATERRILREEAAFAREQVRKERANLAKKLSIVQSLMAQKVSNLRTLHGQFKRHVARCLAESALELRAVVKTEIFDLLRDDDASPPAQSQRVLREVLRLVEDGDGKQQVIEDLRAAFQEVSL